MFDPRQEILIAFKVTLAAKVHGKSYDFHGKVAEDQSGLDE